MACGLTLNSQLSTIHRQMGAFCHGDNLEIVHGHVKGESVDLADVDTARTHWPFLRDRRIDAYGGLTKRLID